ncbi:MAG: ABC transporter substrate-binding protein [Bacillota bacterium]
MGSKTLAKSVALVAICLAITLGTTAFAASDVEERVIRPLYILTRPQASSPDEFESAMLIANAMKEVGIDARVKVMPWEQMADLVWYERTKWDMTGWQMTARPERLDPDEFIYNLFHSSTAETGYNFVGYINPAYDKVAEQQRVTMDAQKRRQLVLKAQQIIADDAVYDFLVHQKTGIVFNNQVFAPDSIKEMAGLGIKNFWTYIYASPVGAQKNMILNSNDTVQAVNPFYISGTVDSWVTELIWDRLMRMGTDGLPKPWAAESVKWTADDEVKVVLRKGMKWHDGKPVTAEDVKFSFEAPTTGEVPMYKPFVSNIDRIDIVGANTLVFKLKKPSAAFETTCLAKINLVPKHIWEPVLKDLQKKPENAESYQEKVPIGSGPFKFGSWKFSEEIVLESNKSHFRAPRIEKWICRFIPNMEASLGMIQNGEINFLATYVGDPQILEQKVKADPKLTMVSSVDLGYRFFAMNLRRPPFNDVAFRRAVLALTDRRLIVDAVWKGFAVPADSVVSPALEFWKNKNLNYPEGGVEEARKILKAAGYEWDKRGRLMYPKGKKEEVAPTF